MNTNEFLRKENGKIVIPVPEKIRYMNEWLEFNLSFFGNQPFIIDKQIPGCGFTEYCLTNNDDIILASPRKMLLKNKENQHKGEIHYLQNNCDLSCSVDKDLNKRGKEKDAEVAENHEDLTDMKIELLKYISKRRGDRKPVKIIVTYDSFKHIKRFLKELEKDYDGRGEKLSDYKIIVDEFQSIFIDSRFKATTEFSFLNELRDLSNLICFVSATPMMDKYLTLLDYFKELPYYELNWGIKDPSRIMRPELKVRKVQSIYSEIKRIIKEYKDCADGIRIPEHLSNPVTGEIVYSREAVFYVNSVNNILSIIKSEGLKPEDVNILCSDTPDNVNKIKKKLGAKFKVGTVPLKGEPHKMFTFCTRTVYLGADFYSTNARTFILSDANIDSLAVDISLDLPQILGRQRLIENPWKNHAEFYFKNLGSGKEILEQEFNKLLEKKQRKTDNKLSVFLRSTEDERQDLLSDYKVVVNVMNYKDDYISIDFDYNSQTYFPVRNELVLIAERRAFDIQQVDYKDRFSVFSTLKKEGSTNFDNMSKFIDELRDTSGAPFSDRLKRLCESSFTAEEKSVIAQQVSEKFDKYYNILGPERCKARGYRTTDLDREIKTLMSKDNIAREFCTRFKVGERYTNSKAKEMVRDLYIDLGLLYKTPKATDIFEYFDVKRVSMFDENKKKINGLEILRIKEI